MLNLIPRLLLITAIIFVVGAARNQIAQFVVVETVKSKTGLELSVRSTTFEPHKGSLQLQGITIPNPTEPGKEFATIDSLDAVLSTNDLLKKIYQIDSVVIRGIHYKAESDEKLFVPREMWNRFKTQFPDWLTPNLEHDWSSLLSGKLDQQTLSLLEQQFESAKFANGITEKWKKELEPVFQKTNTFSQRIQRIKSVVQNPNKQANATNPLDSLAAVLQDAASLETDLRTLIANSKTLQDAAKNDAISLKQSLKNDVEKIKNLKPPTIDQQFLSEVLIGPELNERFATILAWVESVGVMMNEQPEEKSS